ncbi:NAD(P)-dependent dehydrogenase (short-subunit alcohol dehydrogenase family) [Sphingomonas jejuensis]|uniref:NAD(P)-dependent dehydrogenase (Short-subunit alcohol dehydrogenase family) n=1 Tax=Sphingomonas jejuensis TaxID=904715 RepID=A0ABX0XM90_9SPHN|nr:SDR family oxidoreductase [Sphingomonas jejuensis]NJC33982.1 NAD(P)-dependent dehydrogenase (short-subunit alcohol dehydrogenase family) [Sphingomonas jejuensis]
MGMLDGKVAVIIGAAGRDNMGQGIGRRFLAEGAQLVVAGRNEDALAAFADEVGAAWIGCDITDEVQLAALADLAVDRFGGIDIALNATGWGLLKPFLETSKAEIERVTALQFTGAILFYQAMLRRMRDGGSILQISSATASIMLEDHAAYMGTKAGADHVIRCVANEFGHRGIRANSIAPGFTPTPMTARASRNQAIIDAFAREYPLGRVGTIEDVADAAVWLASDQCFMTGQVLQVNGGLTLRRNPRNAEIAGAVQAARASSVA